jgi:hypothetical protein
MHSPVYATRPRARREIGLRSESLETRRLLDASQSVVFPNLSFAIGLPVPSLATGSDLAAISSSPISISPFPTFGEPVIGLEPGDGFLVSPDQMVMAFQASVSLPPITTVFPSLNGAVAATFSAGPSATGPAPTLNPLGNASETAVASASEVLRPTPGDTDRVASYLPAPRIIPLPHLRAPGPEVLPGRGARPAPAVPRREPQDQPPVDRHAPAAPVPMPAPVAPKAVEPESAAPARPIDTAPSPASEPARPEATRPISLRTWDAAIELVESDLAADSSALAAHRAEESLAVGALIAAWGGWNFASRLEGRSRSRPFTRSPRALEAGPADGDGR